jgi:hypothetical protein
LLKSSNADLSSSTIRRRGYRAKGIGVGEALVFNPEQVEAEFVALEDLVIGVSPPTAIRILLAQVSFRLCVSPGRWLSTKSSKAAGDRPLLLS